MTSELFSEQEIQALTPRLAALEKVEPLVSSWRREAGSRTSRDWRGRARRLARWGRDAVLSFNTLPRPNKGQVVVFPTSLTPATIGTLRPILQALVDRGEPAFLITNRNTRPLLAERLHRGHADIVDITAAAGVLRRAKLRIKARELGAELRKTTGDDRDGDADTWLEIGMAVRAVCEDWLPGARALLLDSDHEVERKGFLFGARAAGVPSVVMQHGLFGAGQFPCHADALYCWGEYFRQQANTYGYPAARSVPTGCPRWDFLVALRSEFRRKRALASRLPNVPRVLVLSTAHAEPIYPNWFAGYFESLGCLINFGFEVTLKPHPAEQGITAYARRVPDELMAKVRVLPPDSSLYDALRDADVVYQCFTAAVLEAMQLDVPVLFEHGAAGAELLWDFPDHGGGRWTTAADVVGSVLELAPSGPARDQLLVRQEAFLDLLLTNRGCATGKVTDLLCGASHVGKLDVTCC